MDNGIVFLDKKAGLTSRDVDNALQHRFATKKVGHLGTLDPFATGLLVIGINKGTKFLPYLDDAKKTYIADLLLGEKTATGDPEGAVVEKHEVPSLSDAAIAEVLKSFLGPSLQLPPMTSAIKVEGQPLYKAAHEGKEVERTPRKIEVYSLNLISHQDQHIVFSCTVSRGTYIRVLGEDIAAKLGTVGHLLSLRRTAIGSFLIDQAKPLEALEEKDILDPTIFVTTMKHVEIDDGDLAKVKNGQEVMLEQDYGEKVLLSLHGEAIAVYARQKDRFYVSERGLF
jgi:tRNA pseudouridine55 synthase